MTGSLGNLKLYDFAATAVIRNNAQAQKPALAGDVNRLLKQKWDDLKLGGPARIRGMIAIIEKEIVPTLKEGETLESQVNELFLKLAIKCDTTSYLGNIIPATLDVYHALNQKWEDEALIVLWERICAQLPALPELVEPKKIRAWLD